MFGLRSGRARNIPQLILSLSKDERGDIATSEVCLRKWRGAFRNAVVALALAIVALVAPTVGVLASRGTASTAASALPGAPSGSASMATPSSTATASATPTATPTVTPDAFWLLVVDLSLPSTPTLTPPTVTPLPVATPIFAVPAPVPVAPAPRRVLPTAGELTALESELLRQTNDARAKAGLPPLRVDAALVAIARERSVDMASRHYFSHTTPEGRNVFDMLDERGVPYALAGENLAYNNFNDAESATAAARDLMASPAHRANMLRAAFDSVGIGCVASPDGTKYYTMVFVGS